MHSIKAKWIQGRIVLDEDVSWPEGCRLLVVEEPLAPIDFMTEEEQSNDPQAIQAWIDELRALPPVPHDPAAEAERLAWQKQMQAHNLEAVRRQMEGEVP